MASAADSIGRLTPAIPASAAGNTAYSCCEITRGFCNAVIIVVLSPPFALSPSSSRDSKAFLLSSSTKNGSSYAPTRESRDRAPRDSETAAA